jgi:tetratricopeptide (TPR) repeat protein
MLSATLVGSSKRTVTELGAERLYMEGLVAARSSSDALPASQLLLNLDRRAAARGEYARAAAMMEESLSLSELRYRGAGERGMALLHLASRSRSMGDNAAARARCSQSLQLAANADDWFMLSNGLLIMGGLEAAAGRFSRAARLFGAESAGRPVESGTRLPRLKLAEGRHPVRGRAPRRREVTRPGPFQTRL